MPDTHHQSIGLAELVEQVKQELISISPQKNKVAPVLFVDSVELQLQVTVKREGKGGIKVDVISVGGVDLGGGLSRDDIHKVTVKLSPLFNKHELIKFYKTLHPDQIPPMIKTSLDLVFKGAEDNADDEIM